MLTVKDYLSAGINFPIPEETIQILCRKRGVDDSHDYYTIEEPTLRLLHADILKWIVLGVGRMGGTRDSDNSWSHSDGGYTLTKDDKKLLMDEANGIYEELEPESVFGKRGIRMRSVGIMRAYRDYDGLPLGRKPV